MRHRVVMKTGPLGAPLFWTGKAWTPVLTDAKKYDRFNAARKEFYEAPMAEAVVAEFGKVEQETEWAA